MFFYLKNGQNNIVLIQFKRLFKRGMMEELDWAKSLTANWAERKFDNLIKSPNKFKGSLS